MRLLEMIHLFGGSRKLENSKTQAKQQRNLQFFYLSKRRSNFIYCQENTAQKMKFSIKDFFSKCDQIRRKLRIWSHLLKKYLMKNFIFCAMTVTDPNHYCKFLSNWKKYSLLRFLRIWSHLTFTKQILSVKLQFLCSESSMMAILTGKISTCQSHCHKRQQITCFLV